ncbi:MULTISPECIES: fimbrial protein [Providencia]|uniref:Fimbrial-like protein n=1 Tax=Providencia rettgeri TaxID=587 RepID=A0AAJ6G055_PRORE|nr:MULTISPECIES: fimbrial-like protein [Providencia]WHT81641.1 fimbrial-like protein [Providencia rettgeri]WHT95739.1 fimbrial-like protein [Providencia rettgeri]WJM88389.1 fimbrial-like protein [Providencia rettgeri]
MNVYRAGLIVAIMGAVGLSTSALAGTASATFNFTAVFVGGSCEITAPNTVVFNQGSPFSSRDIEERVAATNESFELTLSNCAGWGLTPSITVSGAKTSDYGEALFRNVGGPIGAKGYGILLATEGNNTFAFNQNLAANGSILIGNWSADDQLSVIDTTLPMTATLTCGDCNYALRQGGDLRATVTFDFVYD